MKIEGLTLSAGVALAAAASFALAQSAPPSVPAAPMSASTAPMSASAAAEMSEGEVRKVDKGSQKLTLRHGEIKNLEMPGMTMVFRVGDPALLDALAVGDKVRFSAERIDGAIVITAIHPLR